MTPTRRVSSPSTVLWSAVLLLGAATSMLAVPALASAQVWEVEGHGGAAITTNPAAGTGSVPGTGSVSAVPSWYFGDGALAVNQALTFFGLNGQIAPLDAALGSPFFQRRTGAAVGFRVARVLTPRFSVEFSFDNGFGRLEPTAVVQTALSAASASFVTAWNGLLSGPSRGTQVVTSAAPVSRGGGQRVATGALVINLTSGGPVTPYVTLGAGALWNYGSPSAQLAGSYQFAVFLPSVPIPPGVPPLVPATFHETDSVTVSAPSTTAAAGVFGGGAKIAVRNGWGVRVDVRDYLTGNTVTTAVTTAPASQVSTPTGIFILGTSPPLQFSTVQGVPSTLSVPLSNVTTFSGTGLRHQVFVTAGLYWRF